MTERKRRVVQTELEMEDYEALATLASRKKMTIKEAAREALKWWSLSNADLDEDPLFKLRPVKFRTRVRSDEMEAFIYKGKRRIDSIR